MAEIDTSTYPRANQSNLLEQIGTVANIQNARETNKLLQLQQQQGQVQLDQSKIDQAHKMYEGFIGLLGSVAQDPRVGTAEGPQVIQSYANNAVKLGYITPEQAATALQTMPQDPAQIPQWLQTMNTQALAGQERFGQIYGTPQFVNNGSSIIPATVSPITGVRPIGAPIQQTLSPEARSELITTQDPQRGTVVVPKAQILEQAGVNSLTAVPETAPTGPANQLIPSASPTGPGVVVGPPAGKIEAQSAAAKASADRYSEDTARETNFQQNILPMQEAYRAIKELGTTGVGPGTEQINQVRSFLISMGAPIDPDKTITFDEANKYLSQMSRQNGFTGSDAQLDAAQKSSPSMKTTNGAALAVLQKMTALARLGNAQVRAFEQTGQGPEQYSKWANDWNAKQNAVAYAFDLMEPEDRLAYIKSLSKEKQDQFRQSLGTAVRLGLVSTPTVNGAK